MVSSENPMTGVSTPLERSIGAFAEQTDFLWNLTMMGNGAPHVKPLNTGLLEKDADGFQKSGVYLLQSPKHCYKDSPTRNKTFRSVFKPLDEEVFERRGIAPGAGALREEAAFIIDRIVGGQAHVPVTARACVEDGGVQMRGSVQQFVEGNCGPVENFGMPHDLAQALEVVGIDEAQAIACFDLRVFNTDRHPGNLLLAGSRPYEAVCIDHGCVLPAWWALDMAQFNAWIDWPHVRADTTPMTLELIRRCVEAMPQVQVELEKLKLERAAVWTMRICSKLLERAVLLHGLSLRNVALLMSRPDMAEPSWLERQVEAACNRAGEAVEFMPEGKYGDLVLQVDASLRRLFDSDIRLSAEEMRRFDSFEKKFFAHLEDAFIVPDVITDAYAVEEAMRPPWEW